MIFKDRQEAGRKLISKLQQYKDRADVIVLGLPRGGIVTAFEIAQGLNLPLDLIVTRKIGAPDNPEFAIGAITEDGEGIFDAVTISTYRISRQYIDEEIKKEKKEAERRLKVYRENRPPLNLQDKTVILVDDGVATGATLRAAIRSAKIKNAKKIVVAVPVIARDILEKIKTEVDEMVYLDTPLFFSAIGSFYEVFAQTEDEEVIALMKKAKN